MYQSNEKINDEFLLKIVESINVQFPKLIQTRKNGEREVVYENILIKHSGKFWKLSVIELNLYENDTLFDVFRLYQPNDHIFLAKKFQKVKEHPKSKEATLSTRIL